MKRTVRTPEQLLAQAQKLKAKAGEMKRKRDTRMKIVLGVALLSVWRSVGWAGNSKAIFADRLRKSLTPSDWALVAPLLTVPDATFSAADDDLP